MHNFKITFKSLQSDGTERDFVRTVAADTEAIARAFARSMVGERVAPDAILVGFRPTCQTEEPPSMGRSLITNLAIWQRALAALGIPLARCTPVYSFQIGLKHNIRDSSARLPEDISEPEIVGFTFRFVRHCPVQDPDPLPWRYYKDP